MEFRQAAAEGNVVLMRQLASSVDPLEAGPTSKKTAAHRAAERGHAAVLRYLFNLGDIFEKKDCNGKTAEQLAKNAACKQVIELVRLAQETMRVVDKVFPSRVEVEEIEDPNFLPVRLAAQLYVQRISDERIGALWKLIEEECFAAPESLKKDIFSQWHDQSKLLMHQFISYATLGAWRGETNRAGACAETSGVAFAYLNYVKKPSFRVEWMKVPFGKRNNHGFLILNRNGNGLEEALVFDPFYRKTFFYAHRDSVDIPLNFKAMELLSSSVLNPPGSLWPQERSVAKFYDIQGTLEANCKKLLNPFL